MKKKLQETLLTKLPLSKRRAGIISPDGVEIQINWENFEVGMSVFVPAINTKELIRQMKDSAFYQNANIEWRDTIEGKKLGVRFWRVL